MSDDATPPKEDKVEKFFAFLKQRTETHEEQQQKRKEEEEDKRIQKRRLPYKDDD